ncbi:MAG: carboxypeptidase-like regulatory domain-containing protein, partial [Formivibrio sp.]|nr:carboxypeptidase-like regulatory domain-containing protein [Formivibrio sp.]
MQLRCFKVGGALARLTTVFCCAAVLLFSSNLFAQIAGTGNIQGAVTDQTGAVVPNASVNLTDQATHVKRTTVSNNAGAYVFPGIPISKYILEVTSPGFKTYVQTGIVLQVGRNISVDV